MTGHARRTRNPPSPRCARPRAWLIGARHIPEIAYNEFRIPLLDSIFEKAEDVSGHDVLCYVNADIILMNDLLQAVKEVNKQKREFLIVGQRWDLEVKERMNVSPQWDDRLRMLITQSGNLHPQTGIDYFVFRKGLWDKIPSFAIGRTSWDDWLLYRARARGALLIDATPVVTIVHQNHNYSHIKDFDGTNWASPEFKKNLELAGNNHLFTLEDATHLFTQEGLKKMFVFKNIIRQLTHTLPALYSWLRFPAWVLKKGIYLKNMFRRKMLISQ